MAKSLIVRNVEEGLVRRLKLRAARNGRSMEAEHRRILEETLADDADLPFKEIAERLRTLTHGRKHTPAEDLIREGRDER